MTNTFDAANRLIETTRSGTTVEPIYNGVNDRVGQTVGLSTTNYALDVVSGLPEIIYTSEGNLYLHLPGVIMAESAEGDVRYLLSDGLGSVRQAVDDTGAVVAYNEYDPYGNPVDYSPFADSPFAYTGEWWENEVGLLHLRARWYLPETGTFLSVDPVESEPPYQYVRGNPINHIDPDGDRPIPPPQTPLPHPDPPPPDHCSYGVETFTIHFHFFEGGGPVEPEHFVSLTNNLYWRYDVPVRVKKGTVNTYSEYFTKKFLGDEMWIHTEDKEFNPTDNPPEVNYVQVLNRPIVNAYFVKAIANGIYGKAFPNKSLFFVARESVSAFPPQDRTFYHELGHLIHGKSESSDPSNYMATGTVTGIDNISPTQKEEIIDFAKKTP